MLPLSVSDLAGGYSVLKVLQALVISLAAVPVYFWARSVVPRRWALVAAALTLALPGLAYSGLVMSEVEFYPALVLAAWAMAAAIASPTRRHGLLALGALVLAIATRTQAVVLLPALVIALVLDALLARSPRRLAAHGAAARRRGAARRGRRPLAARGCGPLPGRLRRGGRAATRPDVRCATSSTTPATWCSSRG